MLFTHGWGGNRFQHEDKMQGAVDAFDLVCVSVEFRQSGYAFGCGSFGTAHMRVFCRKLRATMAY
jgi:hypothetical protein